MIPLNGFSASPPSNTIPVIGLKPAYDCIDTEFLCFLSWHHFDGISRQFYPADSILARVVLPADTVGMLTVVNPWNLTCITHWYSQMFEMNTDSAYARPGWDGYVIDDNTVCTSDTILARMSALEMEQHMSSVAAALAENFNQNSNSVWFYYGYDEAPAWQWMRMMNDSGKVNYDNYMPNLFTMEMANAYRPELNLPSDSLLQPTFTSVDSLGVLSWMAWHIRSADPAREMSYITSCLHTIAEDDWADFTNVPVDPDDPYPGTPAVQANSIRALFSMKFQEYSPLHPWPDAVDNYPSFIALDAYPFRLIGTQYQVDESYIPTLGSSLENWMIDHYEECMDSTFIPAWRIRNDESKDISVFFVPQAFGRAGGEMWDTLPGPPESYVLHYDSYPYRIPTPQEFRMHCNSALIRGAKAIMPYCLTSYMGGDDQGVTDAGLLDENNIPFNAPFEEWAYTTRPQDSLTYINPDLFPPFMNGYDPLYSLPLRPIPGQGSQRNRENFLLWKFEPYGRLWNSVRRTFGEIARVAPELALLNWWDGYENLAEIDYDGPNSVPILFSSPQIKVFTDENESSCYLFYLNRYCRENGNPFEITLDATDFPAGTPFSEYALDHSRRFLVEGEMAARDVYVFRDTLDAGESRLLQMFDYGQGLDADIRITDPDLFIIRPADGDTLTDYAGTPGELVSIHARFYNMGTEPLSDVLVFLYDETDEEMLDTARVSFSGLNTDSCYRHDMALAVFTWTPGSNDIGVHRLLVYTQSLNEPDPHDNQARLVYVVRPRDYATHVLSDPWDMTEAQSDPPLWHTDDIVAIGGEWQSAGFTDSISGMFEGVLSTAISGSLLIGDVSLNVDENLPIDTDLYRNLSFAAVCMNPNPNATPEAGAVAHLWWIDSSGDTTSAVNNSSFDEIGAIRNGNTEWRECGPLDLSSVNGLNWSDADAVELWLSFRTGKPNPPAVPQPVDIRIGWIKLTE
jgi:hypothetical protein